MNTCALEFRDIARISFEFRNVERLRSSWCREYPKYFDVTLATFRNILKSKFSLELYVKITWSFLSKIIII